MTAAETATETIERLTMERARATGDLLHLRLALSDALQLSGTDAELVAEARRVVEVAEVAGYELAALRERVEKARGVT